MDNRRGRRQDPVNVVNLCVDLGQHRPPTSSDHRKPTAPSSDTVDDHVLITSISVYSTAKKLYTFNRDVQHLTVARLYSRGVVSRASMQAAAAGAGASVSKAAPETSTTPANAIGILDTSLQSLSIKDQQQETPQQTSNNDLDFSPRPSLHSYSISSHDRTWSNIQLAMIHISTNFYRKSGMNRSLKTAPNSENQFPSLPQGNPSASTITVPTSCKIGILKALS
jgi:hypothetical protein